MATLGLNIIVGKGEQVELARCLKSATQGPLFDEIVVTQTWRDDKVRYVIDKYKGRAEWFKWIDDFGAARNYSFSKSTTDYIMWLDSDDVIKPDQFVQIQGIKSKIQDFDMVLMNYNYCHDNNDKAVLVLPRERIVRRCPEISWHDSIHEFLNIYGRIARTQISIDHYRAKAYDPGRNPVALKKAYDNGGSPRIAFYYGKELTDINRWDEAVPILTKYLDEDLDDFIDNKAIACSRLAMYYSQAEHKDMAKALTFARQGIRWNHNYAENVVLAGQCFEINGDNNTAAVYYEEALHKNLGGTGMAQMSDFYDFIPSCKLMNWNLLIGNVAAAKKYGEDALKIHPDNQQVKDIMKKLP